MEALILQLLSGAIGGTAVGALFKKITLGTIADALLGTMGGVGAGHFLNALGLLTAGSGSISIGIVISSLAIGSIGGAATLLLIHQIKKLLSN